MSDKENLPRIPTATYRLQFHAGFTFRDAQNILGYLHDLGVSDIYASPFFQASPGSTHGYDIIDHNRLNPDVGDNSAFRSYVESLRELGMGQMLDFVPNHMGIGESVNSWWMQVLEDGHASPYSEYFDIDWESGRAVLSQRVVLPILGNRYGEALENNELQLAYENGAFFLRYFDTKLPIRPATYPSILRKAEAMVSGDLVSRLNELCASFKLLQDNADHALKSNLKMQLGTLTAENEELAKAIDAAASSFRGREGDSSSFDELHDLLERQAYRLSYWRSAAEEINYRRFFDINTLAAIRIEIPEVFETAHRFVFELLSRGDVTGLRIDHVDGLWDPAEYFHRLQERFAQCCGATREMPLFLVVEKILEPVKERLPGDWEVHGTTGYEFANQSVQLFVESRSERKLTSLYKSFSGLTDSFEDVAYERKHLAMENSLASEVASLGRMLDQISEMHRRFRDFTPHVLTSAVTEVIACFPVYRTYGTERKGMSPADEKIILRAISAARRRKPTIEKAVFDFLRGVLLMRYPENLTKEQLELHIRFVMRFQQCTGPVMAKGVEDTAFYNYNRLLAVNEVGGNPGLLGIDTELFHQMARDRRATTPHCLLATSTHDTKRSEDVRMRIAAISEFPELWRKSVLNWRKFLKRYRSKIDGSDSPSANEEYLLYQTFVGTWPLEGWESTDRDGYQRRICEYMTKAVKEAKTNSSWTEPNEEWEKALSEFISGALTDDRFTLAMQAFANCIDEPAALGSLAQVILKSTIPGVPDTYQGTELWDFSLVDPDNRRPVDYALRLKMLKSLEGVKADELLRDWRTGRIKMFVTQKLLLLRRAHPEFFSDADYTPLALSGPQQDHVVAFVRQLRQKRLLVVVPRTSGCLGAFPIGEKWGGCVEVPEVLEKAEWLNVFTQKKTRGSFELPRVFEEFPFAVFFADS